MPDEDVITSDGGPEPAAEPVEDAGAAVDAPEAAAPEPVTFTAEQLAEHLPQFSERFLAHHDPAEALALYGQRDRQLQAAFTRFNQGETLTEDDVAALEAHGYVRPEEEPEEPAQPLWGAPWAEPTDYDSFVQLANTRPDKAMEFIDRQPAGVIDADTRTQVLNYWAEHDRAAAISYEREQGRLAAVEAAKQYADERYAELEQRLAPVQKGHLDATNEAREAKLGNLANLAKARVPDFEEHADGVAAMLDRYGQHYGISYFDNLLALPIEQQLEHITELTGAVAWKGRPAAEAAAQAESAAADAAKINAGGQRGRAASGTNGSNDAPSQRKRDFTASFERLRDVEVPIR